MTVWILEPRDSLIVRDGRPFGPTPGARARSLPFPFPSTTAGGVRTRAGLENGIFDKNKITKVKQIKVRGPLLADLDAETPWLVPAPADALLTKNETDPPDACQRHLLQPLDFGADVSTNLPSGLYPVAPQHPVTAKPYAQAPSFWTWEQFEAWLRMPASGQINPQELGVLSLPEDRRLHVGIDPNTFTGLDGSLFQTIGLKFVQAGKQDHPLSTAKTLALALSAENLQGMNIEEGFAPLGGERRLVAWRKSEQNFPKMPADLAQTISQQKHCRLILLTPGWFKAGWQPAWLDQQTNGVIPTLKAVALPRYQTVSGWDFEKRRPKPTSRLAPAGAVYFLHLDGEKTTIQKWVEDRWLQNISDPDPNGLADAGFGLASFGVWDGEVHPIDTEEKSNE